MFVEINRQSCSKKKKEAKEKGKKKNNIYQLIEDGYLYVYKGSKKC